jgi:excisionase family DNA binding protein
MAMLTTHNKPEIPTEADAKLSQESSRILASFAELSQSTKKLKVVGEDGTEQTFVIPAKAFHLLVDILSQMAEGNAVTLIPIHAELTTQEAADLLNISRPFLIKLLESGELPYHRVGRHRRVYFKDVMKYKQQIDSQRMQVLDQLVDQAQELNMGYE